MPSIHVWSVIFFALHKHNCFLSPFPLQKRMS